MQANISSFVVYARTTEGDPFLAKLQIKTVIFKQAQV